MFQKNWCAAALAAAACSAQAQTSDEVKRLEERVQQLEQRVQESQARQQSESAFNPAVLAILNGVYANLKQNPDTYRINGFAPTMGEVAPPPRGFSLGE